MRSDPSISTVVAPPAFAERARTETLRGSLLRMNGFQNSKIETKEKETNGFLRKFLAGPAQ